MEEKGDKVRTIFLDRDEKPKKKPMYKSSSKDTQICTECIGTSDHDPKNIHEGFDMSFTGVIAEPDDQRMFEPFYKCLKVLYIIVYQLLYSILIILTGPCLVVAYGLLFSCFSYVVIWCLNPAFKITETILSYIGKYWRVHIRVLCDPMFESVGRIYSQINVKHNSKVQNIHEI